MRPVQSGASSFQSAALGAKTHRQSGRQSDVGEAVTAVYADWCRDGGEEQSRRKGDRKGDLCMCYCYDSPNTHTHSSPTPAIFYANRTWLRHQTGTSLRPKAEILHHHPYSLYIWSLVNQSCLMGLRPMLLFGWCNVHSDAAVAGQGWSTSQWKMG